VNNSTKNVAAPNDSATDILELFDYAWQRLWNRLAGLAEAEWNWQPTADSRVGIRWRLQHLADTLAEGRNALWLASTPADAHDREARAAGSLDEALTELQRAYAQWRANLARVTDAELAQPIGAPAGRYGAATRRSFALHIADELVHHASEAALLRDLHQDLLER
jgi:uncharacterized damage-inducible protein DinB